MNIHTEYATEKWCTRGIMHLLRKLVVSVQIYETEFKMIKELILIDKYFHFIFITIVIALLPIN